MVIASVELTYIGSNVGIFPDESTISAFPFSSIVWLCKFPSFAVKWYSSLVFDATLLLLGSLIELFLWLWWCLCFCWCNMVPLKSTLEWMVVLPSRLINSNVIPCCKWKLFFSGQMYNIYVASVTLCKYQLTDCFAQWAYARNFFVPEKLVAKTFLPINRCQRRALQQGTLFNDDD